MATTLRAVRVSDSVWDAARERARREGRPLSSVIVSFLTEYGNGDLDARVSVQPDPPRRGEDRVPAFRPLPKSAQTGRRDR